MRLAVTGATGGVGVRLVELALAQGHSVAALVRDPSAPAARALAGPNVRLVRGDLASPRALADLARSADAFLHLAAHVGDTGTREEFYRTNVIGTSNALDAAAAERVLRFVHLSSSAVYGRPDRGRVTEEWPTRFTGTSYEDTKTEAERLVFDRGPRLRLSVAALRPPIIYGPHDRVFMPRAIGSLRRRQFLLVSGGRAPLNLVWVDHVVDVLLRAAARPDLDGEAFNVMDEVANRPPSVREVAETIARAAGVPPPRLVVPYAVAMALGHLVARAFAASGRKGSPPISPMVVKLLTRDVVYDASKAVRLLGWQPRVSSLEGVALAARQAARGV